MATDTSRFPTLLHVAETMAAETDPDEYAFLTALAREFVVHGPRDSVSDAEAFLTGLEMMGLCVEETLGADHEIVKCSYREGAKAVVETWRALLNLAEDDLRRVLGAHRQVVIENALSTQPSDSEAAVTA